jgi:hypothetical protein
MDLKKKKGFKTMQLTIVQLAFYTALQSICIFSASIDASDLSSDHCHGTLKIRVLKKCGKKHFAN